jgi:hypothetical protein
MLYYCVLSATFYSDSSVRRCSVRPRPARCREERVEHGNALLLTQRATLFMRERFRIAFNVVEHSDPRDRLHGALDVGFLRVRKFTTRMRPTSDFNRMRFHFIFLRLISREEGAAHTITPRNGRVALGDCSAYLQNNGSLDMAQAIATHESSRTTKLYDRRQD